ncbi:MAG TPA: hypothetical protein VGN09_01210 [Vicinamibacteria bacterium]
MNDSEKPGSVLVFPKFIRGTFNDTLASGQAVHAKTELELSVRCPDGATCNAGDRVRMRAHWVCPGCTTTSFDLETTVNGSLYFNPEGVTVIGGVITAQVFPNNATTTIPQPLCERGYLIVWVVDGSGKAIRFDGLVGDAVIRDAPLGPSIGGAQLFSARTYNAIPIQASDNLRVGDLTDLDGDGALDFGQTDFGYEYLPVTGRIFGTLRYESAAGPQAETHLTLLTLDVAANRPNPATNVGLNFYTTGEALVDTATSFTCWTEKRLTEIQPGLTEVNMGRKGLVESTYAEQHPDFFTTVPVTLLGVVESKEFFGTIPGQNQLRDYAYSLYNDGNPVNTAFKP